MQPVDSIEYRCHNDSLTDDTHTEGHSKHDPIVPFLPISLISVQELQRECEIAPCEDKDKQDKQVHAKGTLTLLLFSLLREMRSWLAFLIPFTTCHQSCSEIFLQAIPKVEKCTD